MKIKRLPGYVIILRQISRHYSLFSHTFPIPWENIHLVRELLFYENYKLLACPRSESYGSISFMNFDKSKSKTRLENTLFD